MEIDKQLRLESKNLTLRIPSLEDIPHVFSATKYKGFNDGMGWDAPISEDELIDPFKRNIKAWENGIGYSFSIVRKKTEEFYGRISIRQTKIDKRWNVGFWTHPKFQNKGIMTEALGAILEFGFEVLNAESIEAFHALWNTGSEKVLKKNGMKFIKYVEKGFKKQGEWVEENQLAIGKVDWINTLAKNNNRNKI